MKKLFLIAIIISLTASIHPQGLSRNVANFVDVPAGITALTNATIIDGTGSGATHNMTIIINNNLIEEIIRSDDAIIPGNARVIDCTGKTVIPGLVMLHEHLFYSMPFENHFTVGQMSFTFPRLYLAGGVTTIRTAASIETQTDLNLKQWIDRGKITGPKIDVTGPFIDRQGIEIPELTFISNSEQAGQIVNFWADKGVSSFKV
ncbi:MAG: hypothetical protein JSV24_03970, partial [Bacteroidales bacterium]